MPRRHLERVSHGIRSLSAVMMVLVLFGVERGQIPFEEAFARAKRRTPVVIKEQKGSMKTGRSETTGVTQGSLILDQRAVTLALQCHEP